MAAAQRPGGRIASSFEPALVQRPPPEDANAPVHAIASTHARHPILIAAVPTTIQPVRA
jgi:hypothetical protein